ncbi:MAG: hypothetical protein OHK0046_00910 [Anaerolineae bacterium]
MTRRVILLSGAAACFLLAAVLILQSGLPQRADYTGWRIAGERIVAPEVGFPAPPFSAPTLAGERVSLDELRGAPVILNFWATWCAPCRLEMPELQAFYEANPEVRILAVNMGEAPDAVQQWVNEFGLTFDMVLDAEQRIALAYRVRVQPSTFFISPEGVITRISYGPVTRETLDSVLSEDRE